MLRNVETAQICVDTAGNWVDGEQNISVCALCWHVCVCAGMYLLKLLSAGIVGLAVVAVCTYRADCIP